jgi:hypothetical protein
MPGGSKDEGRIPKFVVTFLQEFGSVAFQLTCLARLGTHDWFYKVTDSASGLNVSGTPDLASSFSVASTLVLFLTLLIFTGPFVNTYLTAVDYLIIDRDFSFQLVGLVYFLGILGAHIAGAFTAAAIVTDAKDRAHLTWQIPSITNVNGYDNTGAVIEEAIAVCSLMVGFLYLKSMDNSKKERKKDEIETKKDSDKQAFKNIMPYVPMKFIMRLTLLVACVCRAFPDAHLSPHVSIYKARMGLDETWGFRIGGGLIGVLITVVWWYMRLWYTKMLEEWDGKKTEDGNNEEKTPALKSDLEATGSSTSRSLTRQPSVGPSTITTEARMHPSGLRISLADSRYF